jgi:hypothetical protein
MKLFFDLPGFVFVVGLDQAVIERSIEVKYSQPGQAIAPHPQTRGPNRDRKEPETARVQSPINGGEYIKKIFQVPFSLPPIARTDLRRFFDTIIKHANLPTAQRDDLRETVVPHLAYLSPDDTVNPREVKRFVNAYTIQLKMLAPKLRARLDPHVVLALLTMSFRADWERVYGLLVADPNSFKAAVREAGPDGAWVDDEPVPPSLLAYLSEPIVSPLLDAKLEPYVTSVEATQTSDRSLQAAQAHLSKLRRQVIGLRERSLGPQVQSELHEQIARLQAALASQTKPSPLVSSALAQLEELQLQVKELGETETLEPWRETARARLDQVREIIVALRQQAGVGARGYR